MDTIREGWFSELSSMWPGQCLSLEVEQVLCHEKSKYQDVMVLQTYVMYSLYICGLFIAKIATDMKQNEMFYIGLFVTSSETVTVCYRPTE